MTVPACPRRDHAHDDDGRLPRWPAGAIGAVEDRLGGFDVAKGTIRFTPDSPVPDDVLTDLVRARAREIDGR
jgi:uncharacterized protein YdhG (YjbR/CyaY superfamily)